MRISDLHHGFSRSGKCNCQSPNFEHGAARTSNGITARKRPRQPRVRARAAAAVAVSEVRTPLKLLVAGGGSGGHVFPALAVAKEWLARGPEREVVFVGTERGLETRLVPEAGIPLEFIRSAGLKGMRWMKLVRNLAMLPGAFADSNAHFAAPPFRRGVWSGRLCRRSNGS